VLVQRLLRCSFDDGNGRKLYNLNWNVVVNFFGAD